MSKTAVLIEALDLTEAQIDAENRTVRQVLIRAGKSKNKRVYEAGVLESARPLFDNVKTYANHPSKSELKDRPERSVRELTGWISEVAFEEGKLIGTRHFTRTQAGNDAWALVEDIVSGNAPASLMGASINAVGKARVDKVDGEDLLIVESIEGVNSVDDVTSPAAGGGFERLVASDAGDLTADLLKLLTFEEWFESHPQYIERVKKEIKNVRLEEATKDAIAEADRKVQAAIAEAGQSQQALTEAQEQIVALTKANARLLEDATQARRDLALEKALAGSKLPQRYITDLRKTLPTLPAEQWTEKIEIEISKAESSGTARAKVPVTGAGYQESKPIEALSLMTESTSEDFLPRDDETVAEWQARTARLNNKRK